MFAFLALAITLIAEIVSRANKDLPHPVFNVLAAGSTLAALIIGGYAQVTQLRQWSWRVKRRLLIGIPVALLTAIAVTSNFYAKYAPLGESAHLTSNRDAACAPVPENTDLIKPGWYGELQLDGLLLVVTAFEDNASEALRFNRRLYKPVSYATASIINYGSPVPVVLQSLQAGLSLDSGETVQSLAVRPLLEQKTTANADLLRRLTEPQELVVGAMLPDLPICVETNFPWAHVSAVSLRFSTRTVAVPGRMMTADEKRALLDKSAPPRPANVTNITAEAWFKNL